MTKQMKRMGMFSLILAGLTLGTVGCVNGKTQVNTQERAQIYAEMKAFAGQKLQLKAVPCGELPLVTPDTPCYVTELKAAQVREILEDEKTLHRKTGWRDDYGVTGTTFAWRNTGWSFGIVYARADLEDYREREDIRDHEGLIHIIIDTL